MPLNTKSSLARKNGSKPKSQSERKNADSWQVPTQLLMAPNQPRTESHAGLTASGSGNFWVDGLFFGGKQYSSTARTTQTSQANFGLSELVEVNEEYCSD